MKTILSVIFVCLSLSTIGQVQTEKKYKLEDALVAKAIYDEHFNSIKDEPEYWLAERLFGITLQEMVDKKIIHTNDMKGFAIPLGVHNRRNGKVDFSQGMLDMWIEKAEWMQKKNRNPQAETMLKALQFVDKSKNKPTYSSLRAYRSEVLTKAIQKVKQIHQAKKSSFSADRLKFMDIFMDNFSPNVMLGYNIQELVPPTHMVSGRVVDVNPLFKAYYFDRLLQEGGLEIVEGFPARFDALLSHGPFQMTDLALDGINKNKRLFDEFKVYPSMSALKNIEDHATAAAFFAYYNWEVLSNSLQASDLLDNFTAHFSNYQADAEKQKRLRVLIAGMTACMHHQPAKSRRMLREILKTDKLDNIHYEILEMNAAGKQLRKYYRSAAEAYLLMKVYHKFEEKYGK